MKTNIEAKEHAIKTIQYEEWLKHQVKCIVEDYPEISDVGLIELVNDKYNDTFFYDEMQYKVKQEGEELVKYFSRMNPKGTSRQDIKEFINTILSLKAQVMPFTRKFTGLVSQWNPDKKKFAKNVAKVFFNVTNNEGTLEAVRKFFANLQYNMGNPHFTAQQSLLYLLSKDFGGTGKTYFIEQLVKWANERKLPTCHANVDTAYLGREFNNSLIGYVSDYNPSRQVFETLNQLVDNVTYISKQKYQNEIELESRITFVMGSNYMVQDGNSRRWSVVDYNIYPYSEWTSAERSKASNVDYMNVFDTLLNSVPAEKFKVTQQADKNDRSVQWEEILLEMREELDDRKKYSSKGLWVLAEPHMTSEQNKYLTLKSLRMFLAELGAKKKIIQYMDSRGNSQYSKLVTYIDSISQDEFEEVNYAVTGTPIDQCKSRWNQIISSLDDNNPVPPTGNDDPDEFIFNSVPVNDTIFDEEIEFTQPTEGNDDVKEEHKLTEFTRYAKEAGFKINDNGYFDVFNTDLDTVFNDGLTDEQLLKSYKIFMKGLNKGITNARKQPEKVMNYFIDEWNKKFLKVHEIMKARGLIKPPKQNNNELNLNAFEF